MTMRGPQLEAAADKTQKIGRVGDPQDIHRDQAWPSLDAGKVVGARDVGHDAVPKKRDPEGELGLARLDDPMSMRIQYNRELPKK